MTANWPLLGIRATVGTALQVQAATTSAPAATDVQLDASAGPGYWAIWAEAASH